MGKDESEMNGIKKKVEDSETVPDDPEIHTATLSRLFFADRDMLRALYELTICCSLPRPRARPHGRTRPYPALAPTSGQAKRGVSGQQAADLHSFQPNGMAYSKAHSPTAGFLS